MSEETILTLLFTDNMKRIYEEWEKDEKWKDEVPYFAGALFLQLTQGYEDEP